MSRFITFYIGLNFPFHTLKTMKMKVLSTLLMLTFMLIGCTSESYDSGDGRYSAMRADFTEARTDGTAAIVSFTTDDGESLNLTQPYKPSWNQKADTTYRALIYYNKVQGPQGKDEAQLVMLNSVAVPVPKPAAEFKEGVKTDPVVLNSTWISRSGRYLNLDLSLKTGKTDDKDAIQTLGIAIENTTQSADGHTTMTLTLYHDQGTVPEYYSTACYVSVPLFRTPTALSAGDTVRINVSTYSGKITKTFTLKGQ